MPPKTATVDRPVWRPRASASARICATSSRVGATTSARGPRGACAGLFWRRRVKIVTRNAAVLPVPVWAWPATSRPARAMGRAFAWIGRREDESRVGDPPADLVRQRVFRQERLGQVVFGGGRGHGAGCDSTVSSPPPAVGGPYEIRRPKSAISGFAVARASARPIAASPAGPRRPRPDGAARASAPRGAARPRSTRAAEASGFPASTPAPSGGSARSASARTPSSR